MVVFFLRRWIELKKEVDPNVSRKPQDYRKTQYQRPTNHEKCCESIKSNQKITHQEGHGSKNNTHTITDVHGAIKK